MKRAILVLLLTIFSLPLFAQQPPQRYGGGGLSRAIADTLYCRLTGCTMTGVFQPDTVVFASLGTPTNSSFRYCSDCTAGAPCTGGGTGAFAARTNGAWNCSIGSGGATAPLTLSAATASNTILTLKTTDDNTTNPLLQLSSSVNANIGRISATGQFLTADGSAVAPAWSFFNAPGMGGFNNGNTSIRFAFGGVQRLHFDPTIIWVINDAGTFVLGASADVVMSRRAAGVLQQGNADAGAPIAQTITAQGGLGSNIAGQDYTVQGSLGTGNTVPTAVNIAAGAQGGASGTTQQTAVTRLGLNWTKVLTNNTVTTVANVTNASNTVAAGVIRYAVEVFNGTDAQIEVGEASYMVSNKAGVWSGTTTVKYGNQQNMTAGTLTVTWTITGANPALLQINANSSLVPSAGYPRLTYSIDNLTQQAVVRQ